MKANLVIAGTLIAFGALVSAISYQVGNKDNPQPSQIIKPMESEQVQELKKLARQVVVIDQLALDKECVRLPSDYLKYSNRSAELRQEMDTLKSEFERVEARLSRDIRANPGAYGLEKVTESAITAVISTKKEYRQAQAALGEARFQLDLIQGVLAALDHKKRSLTLLVNLHGMSYFASPRLDARGQEVVQNMTKQAVRGGGARNTQKSVDDDADDE